MSISPIVSYYRDQVREELRKEVETEVKKGSLRLVVRMICVVLAIGMFWKPIAALFLLYPLSDLFLEYFSPRISPSPPTGSIKIHDLNTGSQREEGLPSI